MYITKTAKKFIIGGALVLMPFLAIAEEVIDGRGIQLKQELKERRDQMQIQRKEFKEDRQIQREDFKNKIQQRIDGLKKHFGEVRAKRIEQFFGNMVIKMENAIDRLDKSTDRIDQYLEKLSAQGKEVSAYQVRLEAVKIKIQEAETALENAKTKFAAMALSANPKESFKEVKILIQTVSQTIRDAHKALVEVITSIKGASDKATTTGSQ